MLSRVASALTGASSISALRLIAAGAPSTSYALSTSATSGSSADDSDAERWRRGTVNKLMYRSKQRGFLELDLLMGLWAETHIPRMSNQELSHMAKVLDEENPDLFKWLTGQLPPPEHLTSNPVFMALRSHVAQQLQETAAPPTRAAAGVNWVRGWDDSWRGANQAPSAPPAGGAAR